MHPIYKRMLEGLKKKEKASHRKKTTADHRQKIGGVPPLSRRENQGGPATGGKSRDKWSLYILKCRDGSFYTGITNDLGRRLKMHQDGKASRYTRTHGPVKMLYSETCGDRSSALIRECEVKEWPKKKKVSLISGEWKDFRRKKRVSKASTTRNGQRTTKSYTLRFAR